MLLSRLFQFGEEPPKSAAQPFERRKGERRDSFALASSFDRRKGERRIEPSHSDISRRNSDRRLSGVVRLDRRTHARMSTAALPATLYLFSSPENPEKVSCRVQDLCVDGLRIWTEERLPIGSNLEIRLLCEGVSYPVKFHGQVIWRKPFKSGYLQGISRLPSTIEENVAVAAAIKAAVTKSRFAKTFSKIFDFLYVVIVRSAIKSSYLGSMALSGRSDTGETFDHLYSNIPKGSSSFGRLMDAILLRLPAAKASRERKRKISLVLSDEVARNNSRNTSTRILDIGSGGAAYIHDVATNNINVQALCLDADQATIRKARQRAGISAVRYVRANAFRLNRLEALSHHADWKPNVIILSGFIYYYSDFEIQKLLKQLADIASPGALIILSNLISNPNARLIRKVFKTRSGEPWVPICRENKVVHDLIRRAGFLNIKHSVDDWNMYALFCARSASMNGCHQEKRPQEVRANGVTFRLNTFPSEGLKSKGTILFVHGLGYSWDTYPLDPRIFAKAGYDFIGMNLRGHAGTDGEWNLDDTITDVALLTRNIGGKVYVLAHSTGALISCLASKRKGANISGLFLVSPVTSIFDSFLHWHESGFNKTVKPLFAEKGEVPTLINEYLDRKSAIFEFRDGLRPASDLNFPFRYGMLRSNSFKNLSDAIMHSPDINEIAEKLDLPIQIFCGLADEVMPIQKISEFYTRLSSSKKNLRETSSSEHFHKDDWPAIQSDVISFLECDQVKAQSITAA